MKLIFKSSTKDFIKSISFKKFELYQNSISELSAHKNLYEATLITANEKITCSELTKLKLELKKLDINFSDIYSMNSYIHLANNQSLIYQLCLNLVIVFNIYL